MELRLFNAIFYELVFEEATSQKTFSQLFNSTNILDSRENALNSFLETVLYDDPSPEELFVTMYMHHLKTGERLEIIDTASYQSPGENLKSLERELFFYQQEGLANNVAIYNYNQPNQIQIIFPRFRNAHLLCNSGTTVILAAGYSIFLGKKEETYMVA